MSNARGASDSGMFVASLRPIGAAYWGRMYSCGLTKHLHYLVRTVFSSHCRGNEST
jgi:hypothetical protein